MRLILLPPILAALAFGPALPAHASQRPVLRAIVKRAADGTVIYGDGAAARRAPPAPAKQWRG